MKDKLPKGKEAGRWMGGIVHKRYVNGRRLREWDKLHAQKGGK